MIGIDNNLLVRSFTPGDAGQAVFADPETTLALPAAVAAVAAVTAATGTDALTHNIESRLSPACHPLCEGIALEGLRNGALATAVHEPGNPAARADMMMRSTSGAIALQEDLGSVHACAHALSAVADLHDALANTLMIDTVVDWNFEAVPGRFDEPAHAAGVPGSGAAFALRLRALKSSVGISGSLVAHGVAAALIPAPIPALVDLAAQDFAGATNLRPAGAADDERLILQAM